MEGRRGSGWEREAGQEWRGEVEEREDVEEKRVGERGGIFVDALRHREKLVTAKTHFRMRLL